jgi:hypothetical protein
MRALLTLVLATSSRYLIPGLYRNSGKLLQRKYPLEVGNPMRKNLLLITIAALGSASIAAWQAPPWQAPATTAVATMAAPATIAEATNAIIRTAEHGTPGALQDEGSPDFNFSCPTNWLHGSPTTFTVKATGIHIRQTPASNGTVLYSIAKGASFKSRPELLIFVTGEVHVVHD